MIEIINIIKMLPWCFKKTNFVLFYVSLQLEAFSCPKIKAQNAENSKNLLETRLMLDDARAQCNDLEEQIVHKETLFAAREVELQQLHRNEILKGELVFFLLFRMI